MRTITDDDCRAIARAILDEQERRAAERFGSLILRPYLVPQEVTGDGGLVYFIWCFCPGNAIKIGYTRSVLRRLSALQIGSPHELSLLAYFWSPTPNMDEADWLARFDDARLRGEWFRPVDSLIEQIASVQRMRMTAMPRALE